MRLHGLGATVLLLSLASGTVGADEWLGWRGVEREGRSESPTGPTEWSATDNVAWKTAIPGEGYSSPVVTEDSVYLTTAFLVQSYGHTGLLLRLGLVALTGILAALAAYAVMRRAAHSDGDENGPSPALLIPLAALTLGVCAIVLLGEGIMEFERAAERGWLTGSAAAAMALLLWPLARRDRRSLIAAGGCLVGLSVVVLVTVPHGARAFADGPASVKSAFMYCVIAPPGVIGLFLLGAGLGNRTVGGLMTGTGIGLAALLAGLLAINVLREAPDTAGTLWAEYEPAIEWWMALAAIVALAIAAWVRRRHQESGAAAVAVVLAGALSAVMAPVALVELVISRSHYLAYHFGAPKLLPMLGWTAVIAVCAVGLVGAGLAIATRRSGAQWLRCAETALVAVALGLGAGYFAYARYLPKSPWMARAVVCVDRESGDIRWMSRCLEGPRGQIHTDNSPATPTLVTDGEGVYAYFGTPGLACVDTRGHVRWRCIDLPFRSQHGVASSPILCGESVVVLSESEAGKYLAAVDRGGGEIVWRTERGKQVHEYAGTCRTPCVLDIAGRRTIVVWGYTDISGYDPATGRELWTHQIGKLGDRNNPVCSSVADGRRVYLVGPEASMALDRDALAGSEDPVVWERPTDEGAQCASPVLCGGLLFATSDVGRAYCLDTDSGEAVWTHWIGTQHYSSVTAVGDRIYFTDTNGRTTVVAAEREYRELAVNDLEELVYASIVPVDGRFFLRTEGSLYCIGTR
ncbi:MAG: PQQ-binding-like beta-propeller repeat protein [Armatimonadota bacterium]|nr:PQQ-binding-like beta-propeller repeat protein [Armatimonadota bacterium]